ncbi:unnamed protein product [Closterium sp. NIES-65]|nr:unnamed protein product [Closterium sp. NIES-65]
MPPILCHVASTCRACLPHSLPFILQRFPFSSPRLPFPLLPFSPSIFPSPPSPLLPLSSPLLPFFPSFFPFPHLSPLHIRTTAYSQSEFSMWSAQTLPAQAVAA